MEALSLNNPGLSKVSYQVSAPLLNPTGGVKIPVSFTATGHYVDLKTFLARLETNIRPLTFNTITFGQSAGADPKANDNSLLLTATGSIAARDLSSLYTASTTITP